MPRLPEMTVPVPEMVSVAPPLMLIAPPSPPVSGAAPAWLSRNTVLSPEMVSEEEAPAIAIAPPPPARLPVKPVPFPCTSMPPAE